MAETLTPDLCVIGAGAAGLSVAAAAAAFGVPVVLIERGRMGGECLNVGCVPSKATIAAGEHAHAIRNAPHFGVVAGQPRTDPARLRDHVREVIKSIAPNDSAARFTAMGARVLKDSARFVDARTVQAGDVTIRPRRFVLATGSTPAIPPIEGLTDTPYLTNETIFDLAVRPDHLVIVGGGPIGVELAQAHARLGHRVTLVEPAERILPREDPEMAACVSRALELDGVTLRVGHRVVRVSHVEGSVILALASDGEEEVVAASHLLIATGRKPRFEDLDLDKAGVSFGADGIQVDRGLRTSNSRVYAIGDCAGGPGGGIRSTHGANYQAGLVVRNALFRLPVRVDPLAVPRVVYTDPELASLGLSEEEALAKHKGLRILRWPFAENDRAQAERRTAGHLKLLATKDGRVVGVHAAGSSAGELLPFWSLVIAKGLKLSDVAGLVFPYPTLSEVSRRAATSFYLPQTARPLVRRLLRGLRAFG